MHVDVRVVKSLIYQCFPPNWCKLVYSELIAITGFVIMVKSESSHRENLKIQYCVRVGADC